MANNRQYRSNTLFVGTRGVKEYRASIPRWVNGSDTVLEIGCEWGTTTTIIAEHAAAVIGTDVSPVVIERARERHPHIRFETLDAFDVRAALELNEDFQQDLHRHVGDFRIPFAAGPDRPAEQLRRGTATGSDRGQERRPEALRLPLHSLRG